MDILPIDYNAVLADLKRKRDDLDRAIAVIELLLIGYPAGVPNGGSMPEVEDVPVDTKLNSDAFFGMNISQAAQKYLGIRKKPASAPEIADALAAGGLPSQSAKFASTVNSVLVRNAKGTTPIFAKVKRGIWGLRAWYPNYRPKDDKGEE